MMWHALRRLSLAGIIIAAGLSAPAHAHPDWYLARLKPPNGGQLRNAGTFHMELVVSASEIRLYVTDHFFNKFPTKSSRATAVLVSGAQIIKVPLTPGGDNLLQASGAFPKDVQLKVAILLEVNRYGPQAARFTPFQKFSELVPPAERLDQAVDPELPQPPESMR